MTSFWLTPVRRVAAGHAPREQRWQTDLWRAGDGATSDIGFHDCWPRRAGAGGTQQPQAPARRQQSGPPEFQLQWGGWAELLGSCGPGFWFISHGVEVSVK